METAGALLKSNRLKKNKSLRDIADATKISIAALQAIEGDRREFLQPPSYVRGFIRVYAREIDLDPEEVLDLYEQELLHSQRWGAQRELVTGKKPLPWKFAVIAAVALCVVLAAVWLSSMKERAPAKITPDVPKVPQATTTLPAAQQETNAGAALSETAEPLEEVPDLREIPSVEAPLAEALSQPPADTQKPQFSVRFAAQEMSWIKLAVDDRLPFEIMLRPGESYSLSASQSLLVRIGNPSGLSVFFNEQQVALSGERGKPVDLKFPQ